MSLSEWAERHAILSPETSAQTGPFKAFGYQIGMMDAITDPRVEIVTVMKSARVGYTKCLDHAVGYFIHQDPSPLLVVQPRVEDAEDYSKTEIAPMLRDTPVLAEVVGEAKGKDPNQTILKKVFRNGSSLTLVGANSPGGFRRITARVVLFDEVDGYPAGGAGAEGDQIALGIKRTQTFWNRKIVIGSSPTVRGRSRIEKSWSESDQRRYFVPCPQCEEEQPLEWGGPDAAHGMKWDRSDDGEHLPDTAYYVCKHCGCPIEETDKQWMIDNGRWVATKPSKGHAGFHISALYSLFPNASWPRLVAEFVEAKKDPLTLQTFVNLVLGETWEDRGETPLDAAGLMARRETWAGEVPEGVVLLTVGADTQGDRLELEVVGWGRDEESWSIAHEVIPGDPEQPEVWDKLDAYLKKEFRRADGYAFTIDAVCIDSGGHHTQRVYQFAKGRLGRKVWAIKGESARGGQRSPVWPARKPTRRSKGFTPYIIGVNAAKDSIRARLAIAEHGPGYCHFPSDRDRGYFEQLTSERLVVETKGGQRVRLWKLQPGRANEALDCRVYAYAALCGLLQGGLKLNRRADAMAPFDADQAETSAAEEITEKPTPPTLDPFVRQPEPEEDPRGRRARRGRRVRRSSFMMR